MKYVCSHTHRSGLLTVCWGYLGKIPLQNRRLPLRHSLAEHTHDGLGIAVDDGQQDAGGAIWNTAALFPIQHGARVETESVRELLATQLHTLPYRKNMLCRRIVDNAARQSYFAAHMGKNLTQGCLYFLTHLGLPAQRVVR